MFEQIKNLLIECANVDENMITPDARLPYMQLSLY